MIGFARLLFLELVCAARSTITISHRTWPYGRVLVKSGSSQIRQAARVQAGHSIKAARSPASPSLPRSVITASKLIFIFDKKTRRVEEQPGETEKQKFLLFWVVASVAVAVVGQIKCSEEEGKTLFISEK